MRPYRLVLFLLVGGVLGACSRTHEPLADAPAPAVSKAVVYKLAYKKVPTVDVPNLLGLSIDEVSQRIGPRLPVPPDFADPVLLPQAQRLGMFDSTTLFRARGVTMVASYDHKSREVHDLLLLGDDENELMSRAQLRLDADTYLVLPVFESRRPNQLMGLRVLTIALNQ